MGLISSFTRNGSNLVIDSGLVVAYSKSLISGSWGYTSANVSGNYSYMMEHHRRARMSFRYVGMTKAAAEDCKAAMLAAYTREFKMSLWDGTTMGGEWYDDDAGEMPMAEVAVNHNDDGSYDVVVNVNEDDMRMSMVGGTADFDDEQARVYEGGETE